MGRPSSHKPVRKSPRLSTWDYASANWYFVTVCTAGRRPWFGRVEGNRVVLSEAGEIAREAIQTLPRRFTYTELGAAKVMPDHVHFLIALQPADDGAHDAEDASPRQFGPLHSHSISAIVNLFKGVVTRKVRRHVAPTFQWQTRYHDRIVRNERELARIWEYIESNDASWRWDDP